MPGGMFVRQEVKNSPCSLNLSDEMLERSLKESFNTVITFNHSRLYMIRDILLRKILQLVQQCICKENIEVRDLEGSDDIFPKKITKKTKKEIIFNEVPGQLMSLQLNRCSISFL